MKEVDVYTDGACLGNPGPGGWGVLLRYGAHEKELSGGAAATTNNRMELTAVIEGLRALRARCRVTVYSDSRYVVDAMRKGWARGWRARGWRRADKQPALNPDLWEELLTLCEAQDVTFVWVRGHADNPYNNRCDALASAAAAVAQAPESAQAPEFAQAPEAGG
ncbi:MAG: ribonuclease HI [Oscillospiraceae bacterium]|nr:ribonuclease HI [Oscillospiraceae bacterium]